MKIRIKSTDSHGQDYEKDFKLKRVSGFENGKEYYYEDEYGKCKILKSDAIVEIYRQGRINSKQVFKLGVKTSFTYLTGEFKGKYEIFTNIMITEENKIYLEYDIINVKEVLNKIKLEIIELI